MKRLIFVLLLMFPITATAQRVYVQANSDDLVGQSFVFAFKRQVQSSVSYQLVDSPGQGVMTVRIISVDEKDGQMAGNASAISVIATFPLSGLGSYVLYHNVLIVGRNRVENMSKVLLAGIDSRFCSTRTLLDQWKNLNNSPQLNQPTVNKTPRTKEQ